MARFQAVEAFHRLADETVLLPMSFERIEGGRAVISNFVGDFLTVTDEELRRIVELDVAPGDGLYERAYEKLLISGRSQISRLQLIAARYRTRMAFANAGTGLHLFVVTLRCEHSCPYCQVSRRSADKNLFDMDEVTAQKALDMAFSSPSPQIKIEFQGGEPLLNFELIKKIVFWGEERSAELGKPVTFVITTNLALLNDEVLQFSKEHQILISTSLDGPKDLHNKNRPRPGGNSYELAVAGIDRIREFLGPDKVGALMTTTQSSLDRAKDIIDEYVDRDLGGIFLRPLSPYGFAIKTKQFARYKTDEWFEFYKTGLNYIFEINKAGKHFPEFYATNILRRMFSDRPTGYVDLRSPAGIGLGALVYNYDGRVFASDEGRMLAEMGDRTFDLGDVFTSSYEDIILSDKLVDLVANSLTQCAPQCRTCAFEPHCGADPVYHHATQGDEVGIKPLSEFCRRQKNMMALLLDILDNSPDEAAILRSWI